MQDAGSMNDKSPSQSLKGDSLLEGSKRKRERPAVQVVACPPAFPISSNRPRPVLHPPRQPPPSSSSETETVQQQPHSAPPELLDWRETAKEVRSLGATAFEGQQKRNFKDEQYRRLTGRDPKKQRVPLPIVRGIRRKAAEREVRQREEARQAGLVLPKATKKVDHKKNKVDRTSQVYGPAPSIGRMQQGMFKVKGKSHKK